MVSFQKIKSELQQTGNNRFILSGKGSWIHNPISPYNAALANKQPIADDINPCAFADFADPGAGRPVLRAWLNARLSS